MAEARAALGRQLAASRRAAGLTQEQLAPVSGPSRSTVATAETGRQRAPRVFWELCDDALGTGTALTRGYDEVQAIQQRAHVQAAAVARQEIGVVRGIPVASGAAAAAHVGDLTGDAAGVAGIESLRLWLDGTLCQDAVSEAALEAWQQAVLAHGRASRSRPAGELVIELGADLAELGSVIRRCRSAASLRHLVGVAAQMSGLMCLMFVKLDDGDAFRRWAGTARAAAAEAGDAAVTSWVLAQEAYGHYYGGDLRGAVSVARQAQYLTPRVPSVGAVLAAALEARAHAAQGDLAETRRVLGRAEAILSALEPGSVTASAFGYTEAQFRFHESSAYTRLRAVRPATRAQDRALELCPRSDYADWAMIRLDRAGCLAQSGDAPGAVVYATETLTGLSGEQKQGIIALRGRELVRALPVGYRQAAAVRDFRELVLLPAGASKEDLPS